MEHNFTKIYGKLNINLLIFFIKSYSIIILIYNNIYMYVPKK